MPKKDSVLKIEYNPKAKVNANSSSVLTVISSGQSNPINNLYLLRDGSYSMTGNLNMGLKNITNVGTVDGVDISAHTENSNIHIDHSTLSINAGVGLTGGGSLTSSKTLSLGTPGTIDVSSENLSTGTTHYHTLTHSNNPGQTSSLLSTNISGELTLYKLYVSNELFTPTIKSSSSIVLSPNSANVLPEGSVLKDLGDYNRKWRSLFAAELIVENLVAQNVIATIGGRILVAPTTKLIADVSSVSSTIDVEHNIFSLNDYIYLATAPGGIAQIESMRITSSSTAITGGYRFSVTRNVDGTLANSWLAGDAVVLLREGYIDITSTSTILNHLGPTITIYSRNSSSTWNDFYATVAQGNLRSFVDYSTNVFGIGVGNNLLLTPQQGFVGATVDATNGLRLFNTPLKMFNGNTQTVAINAYNDIWIGSDSSNKKLTWDGSVLTITGTINVTGGNAALTNLSNSVISTIITGNSIQVGSGTKDSTLSGWNIGSSEIVGQLSGLDQVILGTDGKISAGQGNVILSRLGMDLKTFTLAPLKPDPTYNIFAIAWWPDPSNIGVSDTPVARIWGATSTNAGNGIQIDVNPGNPNGPSLWLQDGGVSQRQFFLDNVDMVLGIPGFNATYSGVTIGSTSQGFQGIGIYSNIYAQTNSINIGTSANPFGDVYANRFISTTINGVRSSIGESGNTFSTIYVDNVVASSITSSTQLSGQIWYFDSNSDMYIRHNYNGPKTLYVANQNVNNVMHLDVEGNITLGGNILLTGLVDGVDISFHASDINAHHARSHAITSINDHTATGLTAGQVLRASGETTFAWAQLAHSDLSGIGTNNHAAIDSHISSTTEHGATGTVVGTTNTQTLTNKTLTTPTIADFSNATHAHTSSSTGGTLSHSNLTSLNSDDHTQYYNETRGDARYTLKTTTLTAGNGLTGGGDLSTNRSFDVGAGTMITVSSDAVNLSSGTAQYQIPVTGVASTYTPSWTALSNFAGDGLTFSTGAFQVGAGDGLTVSANSIALTTPGGLSASTPDSSSSNHTHSISTGSASALSVSSTNSTGSGSALARADHIHAITTSSSVTGASILASNSSGGLGLQSLTVATNTILQNNQLTTTSGNLSLGASGNILLEPTGSLVSLTGTKNLRSTTYVSGFTGSSWALDGGTTSLFEVDNLSVRGSLRVYELLIQQIRATNGSLFITSSAKIQSVTGTGPYTLTVEGKATDTQPFAVGDIIRAQRIQIGSSTLVYRSDMTVTAINVGGAARVFTATLLAGSNAPQAGYEYVRLGNTTTAARQGTIYLTSDDTNSPYIDIVTGITAHSDWNTVGKVKMRMGRLDGITGNTNEFGIFAGDGWGSGARNIIASNNNIALQNVPINFGYGSDVGSLASNGNINWKDSANSTIASINGAFIDANNSSLTIETETGSSSKIILTTGNVGIGTTSPKGLLHLGTTTSQTNVSTSYKQIFAGGFTLMFRESRDIYLASNTYYGSSGQWFNTYANFGSTVVSMLDGFFAIYTAPSQASANTALTITERFRVQQNGNVGIGTTSPGVKLEVASDDPTTLRLGRTGFSSNSGTIAFANSNGDQGFMGVMSNSKIGFSSNQDLASGGRTFFVLDTSNDRVGIGTTSPGVKLSINNAVIGAPAMSINRDSNASGYANIRFDTNNLAKFFIGLDKDLTPNADKFTIYENAFGGTVMTISGGKVGIGDTNPTYKLRVKETISGAGGIYVSTTSNTAQQPSFYLDDTAGSSISDFEIYLDATNAYVGPFFNKGLQFVKNAGVDKTMVITNQGRVGIGTTSPEYSLDIASSLATFQRVRSTSFSAATLYQNTTTGTLTYNSGTLVGIESDGRSYVWNYANTDLNFGTNGSSRMIIKNDGNIAIGSGLTNPTAKLHIYGSGIDQYLTVENGSSGFQSALRLKTATTNANWIMYIPASSNDLRLYNSGSDKVIFYQNGSTQLNGTLLMNNQAITGVYSIQQHTSTNWKFDQNGDGYVSDTFAIGRTSVITETGHKFIIQGGGGSSVQLNRDSIGATEVVLITGDLTSAYWFGVIQDSAGTYLPITSQDGTAYFESSVSSGREYTASTGNRIYIYVKTNGSFAAKRTAGSRTYSVTLFVIWR
jgi:hypothetical protein